MADEPVSIVPTKTSIDFATIIGLVGAFGLVFSAIYMGGSVGSFINIPSILIVLMGTMAVTVICFSFREVLVTFLVVRKALFANLRVPNEAAVQILQISQLARQKGILALQEVLDKLKVDIDNILDGSVNAEDEKLDVLKRISNMKIKLDGISEEDETFDKSEFQKKLRIEELIKKEEELWERVKKFGRD